MSLEYPDGYTCDDCDRDFPSEKPYYTFPEGACTIYVDGEEQPHKDCTGALCPDCNDGGWPDDPTDPRQSLEVFMDQLFAGQMPDP